MRNAVTLLAALILWIAASGTGNCETPHESTAALQTRLEQLDQWLAAGPNGPGWERFLQLAPLRAQLASGNLDAATARATLDKLQSGAPGTDLPQMKALAAALAPLTQESVIMNASATKAEPSYANLYARFSSHLLSAGLDRPVNEVIPVSDCILGTSISGTGHTVANVHFQTVPCGDHAMLETVFHGVTYTDTVGTNRGAIIYSTGQTTLEGRKTLFANFNGLMPGSCATACARTCTSINCIDSCKPGIRGNLVVRIATKQSAKKKCLAEAIAADHASERLRTRLDQNIGSELALTNARYQAKFVEPLSKRNVLPHDAHLSTTSDALLLHGTVSAAGQSSATSAPPAFAAGPDLGLQLHDSMINNATSSLLAGKTLTDEDFRKVIVDITGKVPESMNDDDRGFTVVFPAENPVVAAFHDQMVSISVHGMQFKADEERQIPEATITADYKLVEGPDGPHLVLQEDPNKIAPEGSEKKNYFTIKFKSQNLRGVANETILRKKFLKLFRPDIALTTQLPGNWQRLGKLPAVQAESNGGWLVLGWKIPDLRPEAPMVQTTDSLDVVAGNP